MTDEKYKKKYVLQMLPNNDTFRTINELQKSEGLKGLFVSYKQLLWVNFVMQLLGVLNRL